MIGREGPGYTPITGIDTYASSGTIRRNYAGPLQGSAFIGAGYAQSPAHVVFQKNRTVGNVVGVYLVGTSDGITEPGGQLYADVRDNDIRDSVPTGNGTGIRIIVKGTETLVGGGTGLSHGSVQALIRNNRITGNRVGISIDAGFSTRRNPAPAADTCDERTFSGYMDLTLRKNQLSGSLLAPALITFTQAQTTRSVLEGTTPSFPTIQFLHSATYNIIDPDGTLADAYILHPKTDPFVGPPCAADAEREELHNTLRINGVIVPNSGN